MWVTKGCPKCKGDLFIYCANQIRQETCLQCGFEREIRPAKSQTSADEDAKLFSEMRSPVRQR
jgi:Zn ribbon nucleic-acid-binding protein